MAAELLAAGHSATVRIVVAGMFLALVVPIYIVFRREESGPPKGPAAHQGFGAAMAVLAADRALLLAAVTMLPTIFVAAQVDATVPLELTQHFANGAKLLGPPLAIDTVMVLGLQPIAGKYLGGLAQRPCFCWGPS